MPGNIPAIIPEGNIARRFLERMLRYHSVGGILNISVQDFFEESQAEILEQTPQEEKSQEKSPTEALDKITGGVSEGILDEIPGGI